MPASDPLDAARKKFAAIAEALAKEDAKISGLRKGFGTRSMFLGRKMFAVLDKSGDLVVKLAPERVERLIASKVGRPWHPGTGVPLKEYLAVPRAKIRQWEALVREARDHMGAKK